MLVRWPMQSTSYRPNPRTTTRPLTLYHHLATTWTTPEGWTTTCGQVLPTTRYMDILDKDVTRMAREKVCKRCRASLDRIAKNPTS